MDRLPQAAAARVAGFLVDERDLANLCCTCCFWRDEIQGDGGLWRTLLQARFGPAAAAATASSGSAEAGAPRQLFRQLATLRKPVANLDRVIHLDGSHLQVVTEPGSTFGTAVRVHSVSWLELAARFPGVLPGCYRAAWRMRLLGQFAFIGARIIARQVPPAAMPAASLAAVGAAARAAAAAAAGAAADRGAAVGEDPLLPILREDGVRGWLRQNAQHEPPGARTTLSLVNRSQLDAAFQREGSDWFWLHGAPFEVAEPATVYLKLHSPEGYTSGLIFDVAKLERV